MADYKATPEQWQATKERAANGSITDIRLLELRARVEALEAQANHSPDATKMVPVATVTRDRDETGNYVIVHDTATPPPVATDEELKQTWFKGATLTQGYRALYNLGIEHGQASSREVADPAPVATGLVEWISDEIRIGRTTLKSDEVTAAHAILEAAKWLRKQGAVCSADLLELEAGR
jgi:hypothetical protein